MRYFLKLVRFGNTDRETPFPEEVRWLKAAQKINERKQPEYFSTGGRGLDQTEEIDESRAILQKNAVIMDHQILQHQGCVLLADEVGIGKTFEALGLLFLE